MRLIIILMTIGILHVSAAGYGQRITLSEKQATLENIINKIRTQSGYDFLGDTKLIRTAKPISIHVKDATIEDVLDICFDGQRISYSIDNKIVVLKEKEPGFLENIFARAGEGRYQNIDIRGRVVDSLGNALPGASIKVKNGKSVTTSNANGDFYLQNVDENAVLVITYIGYQTREISASANLGNVVLLTNDNPLDEVHVIAYGTTSMRLTTGNIGKVSSEVIETQPVNNPLLALSGRIPGVLVLQNSGIAGSGVTIRIQGINSISKGRDPFYVVDGSPYTSQLLPALTDVQLQSGDNYVGKNSGSGNPFSYLNPSDIESIEVLKDADATAIYGSRAANGAILITTKKGKAGKTTANITLQSGYGKVGHNMNLLSTQDYLEMRKEAYKNGGLSIPTPASSKDASNYDLTVYDQNRNTNWQKELIGGTANYTDFQAGISGGTALTSFRVNGGYHRETTVFPGDFSDVKGSFGVNLAHSSTNQKFKVQFSGNYLNDNNKLPASDLTLAALQTAPNAPSLYKSDGSLNWGLISSGTDSVSTWFNPLSAIQTAYHVQSNNLITNLNLSYNLAKGLVLKTNLGYTNLTTDEVATTPLTSFAPEDRPFNNRSASYANGRLSSWIIEPQINYVLVSNIGKFEFLLGSTFQKNQNNLRQIYGEGYSTDLALMDFKSATTLTAGASLQNIYKYNALFARINYNLNDKYILNLTARRDGSSRFGPENQFHNFGAVGAAWLFSNEEFFKNNVTILSFGKFRASFGTTGNDQIGDYSYLNQYEQVSAPIAYQGINGLQPIQHSNPYLQWELTKKIQGGIDLGFFKNRLLLNVGYFINRSSNQLLGYSLPITTGFSEIVRNFPATVENSGWEISLNTINIQNTNFSWTSSFNFTSGKNKLVAFPNLSTSTYSNSLLIGEPINIVKLYNFAGVNNQTGIYQYYNANGEIVTTPNALTDQTQLFRPLQNLFGGFQNTFTYDGFQLDAFLQFVKQDARNYDMGLGSRTGTSLLNQPLSVLNRWQNPGDNTQIQKYSTTLRISNYAQGSTGSYSDASYIRLKNISLSWALPSTWNKAIHLESCRLFIHGQNTLTFTKYKGLDPESLSINSLPPLKVWTFGIQATL